jgi:formate hydrogenlyase subunit 6/NADH:ubiquinone oxidoreductase subunit I
MTIINISIPFGLVKDINDYSKVVNDILKHDITQSLIKSNIIVNKKGRVIVEIERCIDCGACISICPTDALHFNREERLEFSYEKCIGCLLCLDSCPRYAIEEM